MYRLDRRHFILNGIALVGAGPALAQQSGHAGHGQYEKLTEPGRIAAPGTRGHPGRVRQPGAQGGAAGPLERESAICRCRAARWPGRPPMHGKMHIVGGYGEQRVDRPYHHVYDAASDRWTVAAPLPLRRQPCRRGRSWTASSTPSAASSSRTASRTRMLRLGQRQRRLEDASRRCRRPAARSPRRARRQAAQHRRRDRRHLRHQEVDRLAPRLRSQGRPLDTARADADRRATISARVAVGEPDPRHRRPRRQLPHQFEPASHL